MCSRLRMFAEMAGLLTLLSVSVSPPAIAGTPREAQLLGRINAILTTYIVGEFGGRSVSDGRKPACKPADFEKLRDAAKTEKSLMAFHRQCDVVQTFVSSSLVFSTAYVPTESCDKLKRAIETMLHAQIYSGSGASYGLIIEYEGIRHVLGDHGKQVIRDAAMQLTCEQAGALRATASPRPGQSLGELSSSVEAVLLPFVIGEFDGRVVVDYQKRNDLELRRPVCEASDYGDLREAATDVEALRAFRRRCKFVETNVSATQVHAAAYLPPGHCNTLKEAIGAMLATKVNSSAGTTNEPLVIEYKDARGELGYPDKLLIRGARLQLACDEEGVLRVTAPRR